MFESEMSRFLILFVLPHLALTQSRVLSYDSSDGPLKKSVISHEDKKILLAEKFINIQFLLPFPMFDVQMQENLTRLTSVLETMWNMPNLFCYLNYTNLSMEGFNVDWLVKEVQQEINLANSDLYKLHKETASFLQPLSSTPSSDDRTKRAVPVAAAALGAIGLFGTGISLGSGDCGLSGIFGSCQSSENAEQINRLFQFSSSIADNVHQLNSETNDKFYIVSKELRTLHNIQRQMNELQNSNWHVITNQLETFRDNIHEFRNCDQLLFSRQQINFNFDTIATLLTLFYSNIKSYRAALFAYHVNMMNSIPALLNRYVPMSLLSQDSLLKVLDTVAFQQTRALDRLTLAIPFQELLSYYEARLLNDVLTLPQGLLMTMSIPLASRRTVMTIYQAIPLPMPQIDDVDAIQWDIEADFLAVSEDGRETALVTHRQLEQCIGSSRYSICHEGLATEGLQSSCLALLFFGNLVQAMKVCDVKVIQLPIKERAINLRYGIWLILSATDDYVLSESNMTSSSPVANRQIQGCRICIFTLECGKQITGPNINIRSDLQTCQKIPPEKINVDLPVPLAKILSVLPSIDELPSYSTKSQANLALLKSIKHEIKYLTPSSHQTDDTLQILAKPIALKMTEIKAPYKRHFGAFTTITTSLIIGISSFFISMLLHILITFLFVRYAPVRRFLTFTHTDSVTKRKFKLHPLLTIHDDHHDAFEETRPDNKLPHVVLPRSKFYRPNNDSRPRVISHSTAPAEPLYADTFPC